MGSEFPDNKAILKQKGNFRCLRLPLLEHKWGQDFQTLNALLKQKFQMSTFTTTQMESGFPDNKAVPKQKGSEF